MMEAVSIFETPVNLYQTIRCNIPEDSHLHFYNFLSTVSSTLTWEIRSSFKVFFIYATFSGTHLLRITAASSPKLIGCNHLLMSLDINNLAVGTASLNNIRTNILGYYSSPQRNAGMWSRLVIVVASCLSFIMSKEMHLENRMRLFFFSSILCFYPCRFCFSLFIFISQRLDLSNQSGKYKLWSFFLRDFLVFLVLCTS
jgi:hypothetical protein